MKFLFSSLGYTFVYTNKNTSIATVFVCGPWELSKFSFKILWHFTLKCKSLLWLRLYHSLGYWNNDMLCVVRACLHVCFSQTWEVVGSDDISSSKNRLGSHKSSFLIKDFYSKFLCKWKLIAFSILGKIRSHYTKHKTWKEFFLMRDTVFFKFSFQIILMGIRGEHLKYSWCFSWF